MKIPLISFVILLAFGVFADVAMDAFLQFILMMILANMILGMSLNLVSGFTGQFSLGHAGFMAVGAYTSAFLGQSLLTSMGAIEGVSQFLIFPLLALAGGGMAALAGYVVGLPSLRLKGDYLAIVTLGFGEIIRVVLLNTPAVGGARGFSDIKGPADWSLGPLTVSRFMTSYGMAVFWVLVCFFTIWRLVRSAHGRAFLSVRDDELAAEAMGIHTTRAKVRAFIISSFFAGVAGSLLAHYVGYLNPASFTFNRSVDAVIIVVLGGMGSLSGSLIAATVVTILPELLRPLQEITGVDLRMVIYSLALVFLMILRPQGIFGSVELPDLVRRYVRKTS
jgi:branched-chain amino acid transport system permease protein